MSALEPEYRWDPARRNSSVTSSNLPELSPTTSSPESQDRDVSSRTFRSLSNGAAHKTTSSSKGTKGKAKYIPNRVKRYHERSLDGCLTCRKRRVKCDEGKPVCRRCACGDRECVYAPSNKAKSPPASSSTRSNPDDESVPRSQHTGLAVASLLHPSSDAPVNEYRRVSLESYGATRPREASPPLIESRARAHTSTYASSNDLVGSHRSAAPPRHYDYAHHRDDSIDTTHSRYLYNSTRDRREYPRDEPRYYPRPTSGTGLHQPPSPIDVSRVRMPDLPAGYGFERLDPYFPTLEQQSMFRHYILEVAPQLCVMTMPLADNHWIRHHASFAVRSPAGTNGYEDALRSALLSIASLDIGHKLSQTAVTSTRSPPPDPERHGLEPIHTRWGYLSVRSSSSSDLLSDGNPASSLMSNVLLELSNNRREESLRLLKTTLKERTGRLQRSDAALMLATVLGLATRDRLAAQQDWQEALSIASKAIAELGGPAAFVDHTDPSSLFLIEQIACFDALSSLTSDDYTLFLQPWDDWWFSLMDSPRSFKQDSVLQTFGLHRGMIDMLARMTRVEATRRELQSRTGVTIILSETVGGGSPATLPAEFEETRLWLESTARALVAEIPIWAKMPFPKDGARTLKTLLPVIMNHLYVAAAELYIHSVIFSKPADHPCFLESTAMVLDRSEEAIQAGITKGLLLPISFAAFSASKRDRERIRVLLNELRPYYKFDLDRMEKLNDHLWRLVDAGLTPMDWHLFMKSVGCFNWAF